ncbi:MAG: hypothetical protein ACYDBZ_06160 [Steroidobacteraceae bacterium]
MNSTNATLALLAIIMATTRFSPLSGVMHLQDASWAVFFMAGFYLTGQRRWVLPALLAEAVLIDYISIRYLGVSNYCVTPAYWFIVPAYTALWVGGGWLFRHHSIDLRGLASLAGSVGVAVSVCFFISNASFYWIGGRVADPTWDGWLTNLSAWYWLFLRVPLAYIGVVALIHVIVVRRQKPLHRESASPV